MDIVKEQALMSAWQILLDKLSPEDRKTAEDYADWRYSEGYDDGNTDGYDEGHNDALGED